MAFYDSSMLERLKLVSRALKGNRLKDPYIRDVPVYLPDDRYLHKRLPVFVFLAGWGSRGLKALESDSPFSRSLIERFDEAIQKKILKPFVGVFPDGSTKFGCSQYVNSASNGNYQNYIADEVLDLVDQYIGLEGHPHRRAVLGHSSGGFGALHMGFDRPDRFSFVCSSAGDSFFSMTLLTEMNEALCELDRRGGIKKFLDFFFKQIDPGASSKPMMMTMMILSLASAYAPDKTAPLYGKLFFDLKTGMIDKKVFEVYLKFDPVKAIEKKKSSAKKLKFILLDCGMGDEYGAQWGHRQLAEKLIRFRIHHKIREYGGGHFNQSWRMIERIKFLQSKMKI